MKTSKFRLAATLFAVVIFSILPTRLASSTSNDMFQRLIFDPELAKAELIDVNETEKYAAG
jgi:hypothetical protein